jgi:hypothetical protein
MKRFQFSRVPLAPRSFLLRGVLFDTPSLSSRADAERSTAVGLAFPVAIQRPEDYNESEKAADDSDKWRW